MDILNSELKLDRTQINELNENIKYLENEKGKYTEVIVIHLFLLIFFCLLIIIFNLNDSN